MISKHASVPLYVGSIGWIVTFGCFALGQALIHWFGRVPNVRLAVTLLVITTLTTPIASFAVIATHYKPSAAPVVHIICLYLALILVCANLDFDLVLHFGREGAIPLRGIEPVWSHDEPGQTEIVWRAFGKSVLACLHSASKRCRPSMTERSSRLPDMPSWPSTSRSSWGSGSPF